MMMVDQKSLDFSSLFLQSLHSKSQKQPFATTTILQSPLCSYKIDNAMESVSVSPVEFMANDDSSIQQLIRTKDEVYQVDDSCLVIAVEKNINQKKQETNKSSPYLLAPNLTVSERAPASVKMISTSTHSYNTLYEEQTNPFRIKILPAWSSGSQGSSEERIQKLE